MQFNLKHPGCVYIGGEWQPADVLEDVINPADESVLGRAPVGSAAQVEAAIAAARHAFDHGDWPRLPVAQRQAVLTRFLDALDARKDEIVRLIVAEAGATQPEVLAAALHLLMDGAYTAARLYNGGAGNPAEHLAEAAQRLLDAYCPAENGDGR